MTQHAANRREGFTILEVLIAMVLLSIALTTLAGLTLSTARQGINLTTAGGRQAASIQEVNRYVAMPYDSLPNHTGCRTMTAAGSNLTYNRCVTVTTSGKYRTVTIIVRPNKAGTFTDTIVFRRAEARMRQPLNLQ